VSRGTYCGSWICVGHAKCFNVERWSVKFGGWADVSRDVFGGLSADEVPTQFQRCA